DEFQNYVTPSIATILSEARKYRLDLIIAHQYMSQVVENGDTQIRDAILGNVGSMFVSRIGPEDSDTFEKIFHPVFTPTDLINSDKFTWYVKMIVDNSSVSPFTMHGPLPLKEFPDVASKIRQLSRLRFGRPRAEVAADIAARTKITVDAPLPPPQGFRS
ncbi:MAG: TraM recognition domain-containing protein, partial [Patescibacteria group bacterium]